MSSYHHYTPSQASSVGGGRSGGSLKSCLRKGNKYSSQRSCGATASITTYSSAPQQQLQYQYNQQIQARQDEQSSHRSTSSAPCRSSLIGGGSLQQHTNHSSSHQSIISHASSAPTTTRGGHNSSSSGSYHSGSQHSSNSAQDDERQFMLTSKQLVEHHQSHTSLNSNSSPHHHSTTQTAQTILNIHLPTPYQKIQYYKLLQNNINYLPMFPESNESNSLIIIRYVNRVFGDVLGREVNGGGISGGSVGINCGNVGGSLIGVNNGVAISQIGYPPPSQQSSQQSYLQQQYNASSTKPQTEIIAQSMLSPRSAHPQQQSSSAPQRTIVNSSPKQFSRSGYSLDGDNCNPLQPMFGPPQTTSNNGTSNGVSQVGVSQMSLNVPPPIPMNYHHHQSSTRERASSIQAQLLSPPSTQQNQSLPPPNTGCLQPMYHPPQYHNVTFAQSAEDGASTTHSVTSGNTSQLYQMGVAAAGSPLPQPLSFASSSVANKSITSGYSGGGLEAVGSTTSEGKIDQVIHKIEAILNSPGGGDGNGGGGNSVSTGHDRSTIDRSLIGTFTSSSSSIDDDESLRRKVEQFDIDTSANSRIGQHSLDTSGNSRGFSQYSRCHSDSSSSTTSHQQQHGIGMKNEYQTFQTNDMLPPLKTRESILYYPPVTCGQGSSVLSCCTTSKEVDIGSTKQLTKRPSSYLQLYIKCERSEPYVNQDLDLVTWYRSGGGSNIEGGGKNTANRTLVVKNTTNLEELIIGIMTSFGLSSPEPDNEDVDKEVNVSQDELRRRYEQERTTVDESSSSSASSSKSLGCYNDVCFISDIKTTTASSSVGVGESTTKKTTYLTPLPVPGLYYKYIDRPDNGHNPIAVHSNSSGEKKNEHRDKKKGGSSVLSTDPLGFKRTLLGQILDKPIYSSPNGSSASSEGIRNRLALVYCTPKRQSYVSSRSTQYGTMPETIYHFQILLEGIVNEYDLPSSFASQSSIRCVGATGGVLGGSVMDTQYEINDLNRLLWKKNGQSQQVIGLPSSSSSDNHGQEDELEQILSILGVPLFDTNGNQTPKEFVVDRALYNIYSGKLSMEVAQQTQHTLAKLEGTTEWLARRVEDFTNTLTKGAAACEDRVYEQTFGTEYDEDFEAAVSRLEAKTQWVFS